MPFGVTFSQTPLVPKRPLSTAMTEASRPPTFGLPDAPPAPLFPAVPPAPKLLPAALMSPPPMSDRPAAPPPLDPPALPVSRGLAEPAFSPPSGPFVSALGTSDAPA